MESIVHFIATATASTNTSTAIQKYLVDGGLVLIFSALFYAGRQVGRVNQTLLDLARRIQALEDDADAARYGFAPRPRARRRD